MARGTLRNRKNGKTYNVKNVDAVLKRFPRTYDLIPAKELPKEIQEVEQKMESEMTPFSDTPEPEAAESKAESPKGSRKKKKNTEEKTKSK